MSTNFVDPTFYEGDDDLYDWADYGTCMGCDQRLNGREGTNLCISCQWEVKEDFGHQYISLDEID